MFLMKVAIQLPLSSHGDFFNVNNIWYIYLPLRLKGEVMKALRRSDLCYGVDTKVKLIPKN
jgi:hypothetical protein